MGNMMVQMGITVVVVFSYITKQYSNKLQDHASQN